MWNDIKYYIASALVAFGVFAILTVYLVQAITSNKNIILAVRAAQVAAIAERNNQFEQLKLLCQQK